MPGPYNEGHDLDFEFLNRARVNENGVRQRAKFIQSRRGVKGDWQAAWLLRALTCIDLTTLGGDDTASNVDRLCRKAANPLPRDLQEALGFPIEPDKCCGEIRTAAVCVYPARVVDAVKSLKKLNCGQLIDVASVATGFPSGQYPLKTRLEEIRYCVESGATEVDVVIDRSLVLGHDWLTLYDEIVQMKQACGKKAHMKTILAVGECGSLQNVYRASLVAVMAGTDFIKTSTGKESVNATLPYGIVMCRAIRDYQEKTGFQVGFKPAGGIRTAKDAISWLALMKDELGDDWLSPQLFRIGASGLVGDIERQLYHHVTGNYAATNAFTLA